MNIEIGRNLIKRDFINAQFFSKTRKKEKINKDIFFLV